MTDDEFAVAMNIQDEPWGGMRIIANMTPEKRAAYEQLTQIADELNLWAAGVGPRPTGSSCAKSIRGRRRP